MKKVATFAVHNALKIHGVDVYNKFMALMQEWDGGKDFPQAFYEVDLLEMKLKEALEWN